MKHLLALVLLAWVPFIARAELYTFYAITSNDSSGYAQFVGESQLFMDITLLEVGQVSLVFTNTGPEEAVVTRIYFDFSPGLDLNLVAIEDGDGVEFRAGPVNPKNLPAGNSMDNIFSSDLGVASANPAPHKGIGPSEGLEVIMSYDEGYDILGMLGSEDLRVGLHVQSFDGGYSESFVNVVPEPGTVPMLCIGSLFLRWMRIKRDKRGRLQDVAIPRNSARDDGLQWVEIRNTHPHRDKARNRCEAAIRQAASLQT